MSGTRWAISGLLVLHLAAVALGAIPAPSTLRAVGPARHPTDDPIAARLTPLLDTAVTLVYRVSTTIWGVLSPLPQFSQIYLRSMGLGQQWTMFWDPPKQDVYIRLRYYVGHKADGPAARPIWVGSELVFPAERDDEIRLVHSYWTKDRDKALFTSLDHFLEHRDPSLMRADATPRELPDDLVPVAQYFGRRFEKSRLTAEERLLRTEVWYGAALIPPRGEAVPGGLQSRLEVLRPYYGGLREEYLAGGPYHRYYASEQEGDIFWRLEYFQES